MNLMLLTAQNVDLIKLSSRSLGKARVHVKILNFTINCDENYLEMFSCLIFINFCLISFARGISLIVEVFNYLY